MSKGNALLAGAIGIVVGTLGLGLARLALLPPLEHVHYHANWALWLNGERVDFSDDRYMEDVTACVAEGGTIQGAQRVHLHENDPDVVHVHHTGVTWGHLLQNLGWAIGPDWILTDEMVLYRSGVVASAGGGAGERGTDGAAPRVTGRLTYVLNGFRVLPANDRLIDPGDRLLISFGTEAEADLVSDRFSTVASSAPEYDATYDPAGCMGHAEETFGQRVRRAFWW